MPIAVEKLLNVIPGRRLADKLAIIIVVIVAMAPAGMYFYQARAVVEWHKEAEPKLRLLDHDVDDMRDWRKEMERKADADRAVLYEIRGDVKALIREKSK